MKRTIVEYECIQGNERMRVIQITDRTALDAVHKFLTRRVFVTERKPIIKREPQEWE